MANVRVDVQALNGNEPIRDLAKEDFLVFDNNAPQELLYADRGSEPLSLLLLFDVSGSMREYVEQVADVARRALKTLRARDRIAVMIFARASRVRLDFTTDHEAVEREIREAVNDESVGSATQINVALMDAAKYMEGSAETGRRAIVIVTDNKGLNEKAPDDPVIQALFEADTVLNALVVGRAERPAPVRPGSYTNPDFTPPDVFRIADETGGEAIPVKKAGGEFSRMVERIRNRYGLQYRVPEGARGHREVRVELSPAAKLRYQDAVLRYRKAYRAK